MGGTGSAKLKVGPGRRPRLTPSRRTVVGGASEDARTAGVVLPLPLVGFRFLEPGGRPRPRLTGALSSSAVVGAGAGILTRFGELPRLRLAPITGAGVFYMELNK